MTRLLLSILFLLCFTACQKTYRVAAVIDGDTILVKPDMSVRIIGIDAPETKADSQKFIDDLKRYNVTAEKELFSSKKSKEMLKMHILNKKVRLVEAAESAQETLTTGRAGRYLRYVYLSGEDIGKWMLKNGLARKWQNDSALYFSHTKEKEYEQTELIAREKLIGIWGNSEMMITPNNSIETPTENNTQTESKENLPQKTETSNEPTEEESK